MATVLFLYLHLLALSFFYTTTTYTWAATSWAAVVADQCIHCPYIARIFYNSSKHKLMYVVLYSAVISCHLLLLN